MVERPAEVNFKASMAIGSLKLHVVIRRDRAMTYSEGRPAGNGFARPKDKHTMRTHANRTRPRLTF